MIHRTFLFTLFLVFIAPALADEIILNDTPGYGANFSENGTTAMVNGTDMTSLFGQNLSASGNITAGNVTNSSVTEIPPADSSRVGEGKNATQKVTPTPTPAYKLSIGSVYEPDYQEPQPRTFTYSGCGS